VNVNETVKITSLVSRDPKTLIMLAIAPRLAAFSGNIWLIAIFASYIFAKRVNLLRQFCLSRLYMSWGLRGKVEVGDCPFTFDPLLPVADPVAFRMGPYHRPAFFQIFPCNCH